MLPGQESLKTIRDNQRATRALLGSDKRHWQTACLHSYNNMKTNRQTTTTTTTISHNKILKPTISVQRSTATLEWQKLTKDQQNLKVIVAQDAGLLDNDDIVTKRDDGDAQTTVLRPVRTIEDVARVTQAKPRTRRLTGEFELVRPVVSAVIVLDNDKEFGYVLGPRPVDVAPVDDATATTNSESVITKSDECTTMMIDEEEWEIVESMQEPFESKSVGKSWANVVRVQ
ncbi:hypothetical protein OIO90_001945 [Microbotryomycetes sp. JL221]|nr:hypothetical protein OIO90_001945 [Microbotryomycetes sp. JL221]